MTASIGCLLLFLFLRGLRGQGDSNAGTSSIVQALPSLGRKITQVNEAGVFSVDLPTAKVTFFTGLHYAAPNTKFSDIADKVRYAANLKFGDYVDMTSKQLGPLYGRDRNDSSGVADLDGVVDTIKINHYGFMDRVGQPAFSIEFWIRPRRMPLTANESMALFSRSSSASGFISLNLKSDGSLEFSVAPNNEANPLKFATATTNEDCKVKPLEFQHIAVTGNVASSMKIIVKGGICYTMSTADGWEDITSLPASNSNEGPLVFGDDTRSQGSSSPQKFNGQIAYIRVFDVERTQQQIQSSMNAPYADTGNPVGSWPLRRSQQITLIHYVVSDSNGVSALKVLTEFDPASSSFPVSAIKRNGNIFLFRLTAENKIVAKEYTLNSNESELLAVSRRHINVIKDSKKTQRGCFTVARVARNNERDRWIVITCKVSKRIPPEVIFDWKLFKMNNNDKMVKAINGTGSFRVAGIGGLDTRPSATVVGNRLLLTAGTQTNAETLFLDIKVDRSARPKIRAKRVVPIPVGPNIIQAGISYYSYLYKPQASDGTTSSSSQTFLRRVRPLNGTHSSSYRLTESTVDPNSLTASDIGDDVMPNNDWFWFLFRISTLSGGNVIHSGQRVSIQTPDNNPQNERRWSFVKCNRGNYLEADQQGSIWSFYIFKTKTCDPENGGYTVLYGDIGPNDCVLLWPKILQFGPNFFCKKILAYPTQEQMDGARQMFGPWFGPWRIMVPLNPSPVRPLPLPLNATTAQTLSLPRSVHEGNKYALLHYNEGIRVPSQSGLRAALLRFAKTTTAPVVVSSSSLNQTAYLMFRGNGGPIPLTGAFRGSKAIEEGALNIVYREGSFAQKRFTSGLFYSISYTPPSNASAPGEFKNLARIAGLNSFDYPLPPENFVWLVPPPFKVNGMCEAVSKLINFDADAVESTAPNSVSSLTEVVKKAIGPGTFNEGLFKPLLTVPFDVKLLHEIGQRAYAAVTSKLQSYLPQPPSDNKTASDSSNVTDPRWQEAGDLEACLYLANMSVWKTRVKRQNISDRLHQLLRSDWMKEQMIKITAKIAPDVFRKINLQYSSYGGIGVFIANRLRSPEFLEQLLRQDLPSLIVALQSHLPVLDALRPELGIISRQDIITTMLARTIIHQPWEVLRANNNTESKAEAFKEAFEILVGRNVSSDLRIETRNIVLSVFGALFNPLTSTQLGIMEQILSINKQRGLEVESVRAEDFKSRFYDSFRGRNAEAIATFDNLPHLRQQLDAGSEGGEERTHEFIRSKYYEVRDMANRQTELLEKFRDEILQKRLFKNESPLEPSPRGTITRWLLEDPRNFARVSATLNLIGTLAATGSLILQLSDPNSALRNGSIPAILGATATVIGAIGSVKGVIDFAKVLKNKLFPKVSDAPEEIPLEQLNRAPNEFAEFDSQVAKNFRVNLESTERVTARLQKYFKTSQEETEFGGVEPEVEPEVGPGLGGAAEENAVAEAGEEEAARLAISLESKVFLALGVVADFGFVGLSIYNLVLDFNATHLDPWKIFDDLGLGATALAGGIIGILSILGIETGPAAIIVFFVGLIFIILDAVRAKKEAERKLREARCKSWTKWCIWSKALFLKYHFLIDPTEDTCATCPKDFRKRDFMRALCLRGYISKAHRVALNDVLDPRKDITSLVMKQKTCPAWMRHFHKRPASHKGRKGKLQDKAISKQRSDL